MINSTLTLIRTFCLAGIAVFTGFSALAQCSQTATIAPSSAINDDGTGAWGFSSPGSALFPDNSYATATATLALLGGHTDNLKVQGFGLHIPTGATVCGIRMTMGKRASGINVLAYVNDYRIRLLKNGTALGANRAKAGAWPGTEASFNYGGASDTWGVSWTAEEINSAGFGISISAEINGLLSLLPSAHINDVSITVFYIFSVLPVRLVSFNGRLTPAKEVRLDWVTSGEDGNTSFTVERSSDGAGWKAIETIAADETGVKTNYTYTDRTAVAGKMYFRLAIRNSAGVVNYSEIVTVMEQGRTTISLYPNPAAGSVTVTGTAATTMIRIFNATGNSQPISPVRISDTSSRIDISRLPAGIYYVQVDGEMIRLVKK